MATLTTRRSEKMKIKKKHLKRLRKIWMAASDLLMAEKYSGFADQHGSPEYHKELMRLAIDKLEEVNHQ